MGGLDSIGEQRLSYTSTLNCGNRLTASYGVGVAVIICGCTTGSSASGVATFYGWAWSSFVGDEVCTAVSYGTTATSWT